MSTRDAAIRRSARPTLGALLVLALAALLRPADAQTVTTGFNRAVGGISISPDGLLDNATTDAQGQLRRVLAEAMQRVPDVMNKTSRLRKVSLARLEAAIRKQAETGKPLSDDMVLLAGLQQVRYVLVYPEQNDIVLVGPAEGWKLDQRANVVGATTGRPVLLLDDLLVALRAAGGPTRTEISCSIDPTPEGLARLQRIARSLSGADPQGAARLVEEQLGPQRISFTGVPETSHFAHVLVAADYRMKRISMGLEESPVVPSVLGMIKGGGPGVRNMLPRWWLAPNYEPLLRDADGLAWELRGAGVKALAESDFFNAQGAREKTAPADPIFQKWADLMTDRYEALAKVEPVFGQLRNCMDLAIVGALIAKHDLTAKAGCSLPLLTDQGGLEVAQLPAPKQIASQASLIRNRRWTIMAGGVKINPWAIVETARTGDAVAGVRAKSTPTDNASWWWD